MSLYSIVSYDGYEDDDKDEFEAIQEAISYLTTRWNIRANIPRRECLMICGFNNNYFIDYDVRNKVCGSISPDKLKIARLCLEWNPPPETKQPHKTIYVVIVDRDRTNEPRAQFWHTKMEFIRTLGSALEYRAVTSAELLPYIPRTTPVQVDNHLCIALDSVNEYNGNRLSLCNSWAGIGNSSILIDF
jgi:hypothetical protein